MLDFHRCAWVFSSCSEWGLLFTGVHGLLVVVASLVAERGLWAGRRNSWGTVALCPHGMWDLPRPGIEPVSPALADGLSTTGPPGESLSVFLLLSFVSSLFILDCDIMMYKKYIFAYSEGQDIFLIYILSSSTVPGSQLSKPLGFPKCWEW